MKRTTVLVGDIHGEFHILYDDKLSGCDVYQVGDFGLGFKGREAEDLDMERLNAFAVEQDINYFVIRGNHDKPTFWTDAKENARFNNKYSNITLLPDYYSKEINNKRVLFIGGAVSVDRVRRISNVSWWEGERVDSPRFCPSAHDVIISHTCPQFFSVVINKKGGLIDILARADDDLKRDLFEERQLMDNILKIVRPSEWYFGHFHNSKSGCDEDVKWRCIDQNEKYELL